MKSICSIFLFCITGVCVSSAQPTELNHIVGDTVTFPDAVKNMGTFSFKDTSIGDVTNGQGTVNLDKRFTGRLQWDRNTGLFSITDLKMEDSGGYKLQKNDGAVFLYQLTVYTPVSKPTITQQKNLCELLCSVQRGTDVTLSWHRDREDPQSIFFKSAPASQPLTVTEGTYTCEAKNPVSTQRESITVGKDCIKIVVVSKPIIKQKEGPCSLECSVRSGTEVTLSWYREGHGEIIASGFSHTSPSYQLLKPKQGGNYICEAKNSISKETTPFTVGEDCRENRAGAAPAAGHFSVLSCFFVLILVQFFL